MFFKIVLRQLRHKWGVALLVFLAITALVSLYVFIQNSNRFMIRSMQLVMKNMGLNQIIIPAGQPVAESYLCGEKQSRFSEEVTREAARHTALLSRYYLSVLQQRHLVDGQEVVLTGIEPVKRIDETAEKGNPVKPVKRGTVRLGEAAGAALQARQGEMVNIMGHSFEVVKIIPEEGTLDDCRVYFNLADLQSLLNAVGEINLILAFECLHVGGTLEEVHRYQRDLLAKTLPGYKLINVERIAQGRYYAREMTDRYQYYLLALVGLITALIIIITGWQEVVERRYESGVLMAQGAGYAFIIALYLSKALILTFIASILGFVIGGHASVWLTTPFLATKTQEVAILWHNLPAVVGKMVVIALFAELIAMIKLVRLEPNAILCEE